MFTRRERLRAFPAQLFQGQEIVGEHGFALDQVEAIAAEAAPERVEHSFATARGHFHLGGDRVGPGQRVRRAARGYAVYFAIVSKLLPSGCGARPRGEDAFEDRIIEREHLILLRLNHEEIL